MISSSNPSDARGLDAMLMVYSSNEQLPHKSQITAGESVSAF